MIIICIIIITCFWNLSSSFHYHYIKAIIINIIMIMTPSLLCRWLNFQCVGLYVFALVHLVTLHHFMPLQSCMYLHSVIPTITLLPSYLYRCILLLPPSHRYYYTCISIILTPSHLLTSYIYISIEVCWQCDGDNKTMHRWSYCGNNEMVAITQCMIEIWYKKCDGGNNTSSIYIWTHNVVCLAMQIPNPSL